MKAHRSLSASLCLSLFAFAILSLSAGSQTSAPNQWTWMGGSNTAINGNAEPGIYGTLGTPSATSVPGGRYGAVTWTDGSGNLWLFGGQGYDANGMIGDLNDLWEFDPATNEWTWISGSSALPPSNGGFSGQPGVYGTLGTPAAGNVPGGRDSAASWTDSSGNLWLFGGTGSDQGCVGCFFNDLWKFNPSTNQWTWMGGSSTATCTTRGVACVWPGVYGTLGTPAAGNVPGSRAWTASWTDGSGHFWIFGGYGADAIGSQGLLNDLWMFDPSTNQWTWMDGSNTLPLTGGLSGVYGTLGTPAAGNIPGSRDFASTWTDGSGNLWLFGGSGYDAIGAPGPLNDLWEYTPSTNRWTWMSGSSTVNCVNGDVGCGHAGVYGTLGTPATGNTPGSRWSSANWTDGSSNLWLIGGWGLDANDHEYLLNDLWEFNPSTSEWTWMGGNNTLITETSPTNTELLGWPGVYGTLEAPAAGNMPGSRSSAASWTDKGGNFWLFGGNGVVDNVPSEVNFFNDLWRYQPSTTHSFSAVATPTFSVAAGTYTTVQTVTISDTTPDATIFYTTDGTAPTFSSAIYTSPLTVSTVSTMETVEAVAVAANYFNSAVVSATYNIDLPVNWYTLTTIASSPNPSSVGEYVTFTATVTPVSNSAMPAGTVQFTAFGEPLGPPVPLNSSGVAAYTTAALSAGGGNITATYIPSSGSSFIGSTSVPMFQSVGGACAGISSTTLTSSQNPSSAGQSVTFTATVVAVAFPQCIVGGSPAPGGTFAPTGLYGTVQFNLNGSPIGAPAPLNGSVGFSSVAATYTTSTLPAGTDSITAVFIESNGYVGSSTSAPLNQVVTGTAPPPEQTAATPTLSVPGGTYDVIEVVVTIADATPGAAIYYTTDGVTTPTINSTLYTGPILVTSSETIQAIAEAAPNYLVSAVASATYTIPSDFTVAINPTSISVQAGQSGTATITVQDEGGFNSNVSFACSGLPVGATCNFALETLPTPAGVTYTSLTVTTSATTVAVQRKSSPLLPGSALALALCYFSWKKRRRLQILLLLSVSVAGLMLLNGCGAPAPIVIDPPPVTSTVTVTVTAGAVQHTATFTLTVN